MNKIVVLYTPRVENYSGNLEKVASVDDAHIG
jgi:hypothetical protein